MPLPPKLHFVAGIAALLLAVAGCTREIGDGCTTGTDCSQTGGRTCDTTMPGGYCTVPNCDPDGCPEEAACIGFFLAPSTAPECRKQPETRELRLFCMRRCSSQEDCRAGYVCRDLNAVGNPWGAKRLDKGSTDGRVCTLEYGASPAVQDPVPAVNYCTAPAFEDDGYYGVAGSTSLGSAGSSGVAGNSGSSGSAGTAGSPATSGQAGESSAAGNAGQSGGGAAGNDTGGEMSGAAGETI